MRVIQAANEKVPFIVHFSPFWSGWEGELSQFMRAETVAFVLAKSDWKSMSPPKLWLSTHGMED
ncbi:MAG: hypothetical protein ACLQVY_01400 [Limisphaerales bacterium]